MVNMFPWYKKNHNENPPHHRNLFAFILNHIKDPRLFSTSSTLSPLSSFLHLHTFPSSSFTLEPWRDCLSSLEPHILSAGGCDICLTLSSPQSPSVRVPPLDPLCLSNQSKELIEGLTGKEASKSLVSDEPEHVWPAGICTGQVLLLCDL